VRTQKSLPASRLIFVDETGMHPGVGPRRGWASRGEILWGAEQSYARGQHVSLIGAMSTDGVIAYSTVNGGVKGADFLRFVVEELVPQLHEGDIVWWDNINMHLSQSVRVAILETGATILQLPRYSPDFNPIESAWAKIKALVRRAFPTTRRRLIAALKRACRKVCPEDAQGWFRLCGFRLLRP